MSDDVLREAEEKLDAYLRDLSDDQREQFIQFALDHVLPRHRAIAASRQELDMSDEAVIRRCMPEQAGEPPIVAESFTMEALVPGGQVKTHIQPLRQLPAGTKLVTLQSHREAMVETQAGHRLWFRIANEQGEAIAKKDAALKAAVEALGYFKKNITWGIGVDLADAAITQAKDALK